MPKLFWTVQCTIELSSTCSDLSKLSACSTTLPRHPTKLSKMFTCSIKLSKLHIELSCSLAPSSYLSFSYVPPHCLSFCISYQPLQLIWFSNWPIHSTIYLVKFSLLLDYLVEFSTRLCSVPELCTTINNIASSLTFFVRRLVVSPFLSPNEHFLAKFLTSPQLKHLSG